MTEAPAAYPLTWPAGWPRTPAGRRVAARFRSTQAKISAHEGSYRASSDIKMTDARDRLQHELGLIRAKDPILSTNVPLRLDGLPRAGQSEPADPGAAVYFRLKGHPIVLACDRWLTVAGNIAAIAAHLDAMRGMDRWGVGSVEQLFTGYTALAGADRAG